MRLFDIATVLRSSRARRPPGRSGAGCPGDPPRWPPYEEEEAFTDPFRWQTVTILAQPWDVAPDGRWPAPLAELGDLVEIRLEPAPGDRGTSCRYAPGRDPRPAPPAGRGRTPRGGSAPRCSRPGNWSRSARCSGWNRNRPAGGGRRAGCWWTW